MKTIKAVLILFLLAGITFAQSWREFGGGANQVAVYTLGMYKGDLIAGGFFDSINSVPARSIAKWDGNSWTSLGNGMSGTFYGHGVRCLREYKGNYFAGGYFDTAGTAISTGVAFWDGTRWYPMLSGVGGTDPHVEVLYIYQGILYVGGTFLSAGAKVSPGITCWNGITFSPVGNPIIPPSKAEYFGVYSLQEYQNNLYLGGTYHKGVNQDSAIFLKWDGANWTSPGLVTGAIVKTLTVYNGKLVLGGIFSQVGSLPVHNIAEWDGANWSSYPGGCDGSVYTFYQLGGLLYIGGAFEHSGSIVANKISIWDGSTWSTLGTGMNERVMTIINYPPSPVSMNLVAGGFFNTAGGISARHIATWGDIVGFGNLNNNVPESFSLKQNYPNPFNPATIISYEIPKTSYVKIEVFDMLGRKVAEPLNREITAGRYELNFNAEALSSGTYFYKLTAVNADGEFTDTKKMTLMK